MAKADNYSSVFNAIKEGIKMLSDPVDYFDKGITFPKDPNIKAILEERNKTKNSNKVTNNEVVENNKAALESEVKEEDIYKVATVEVSPLKLDFKTENVRMGFIYSEILGKPKCKRRGRG